METGENKGNVEQIIDERTIVRTKLLGPKKKESFKKYPFHPKFESLRKTPSNFDGAVSFNLIASASHWLVHWSV